jgi:hypothetical protein
MLEEAALHEVLLRTPPRSAEVLSRVALDGWTVSTLAERYGIELASARRLLLRAARDFDAAAHHARTPAPPLADDVEQALADALAASLDGQAPSEAVRPLADALAALARHRDEVKRRLSEAELVAASSPARRRERWLNRLAIAALLALSAWLYWREQHQPPPAPPPRPALPPGGR